MKKLLTLLFLLKILFGFAQINEDVKALEELKKSEAIMFPPDYWSNAEYYTKGNWNWISERLFNGVNKDVPRYQGDINIQLVNSQNPVDSIIITDFIKKLKYVIPNKITFSTQEKGNLIIEMMSTQGTGYSSRSEGTPSRIIFWHHKINSDQLKDIKVKRSILQFYIARSLCVLQPNNYGTYMSSTYLGNSIFNNQKPEPEDTGYGPMDHELLYALYSPNLFDEAKAYFLERYSYRFYLNFFYKIEMKFFGVISSVLIAFLIFILSYRSVFRRRFKVAYFNYLMPGLVLMFTSHFGFHLYDYLTSSAGVNVYLYSWLVTLIVYMLIWLIGLSLLYVLENSIINKEWTIVKQLKMKIIFTFLVSMTIVILFFVFSSVNKFNFILAGIGVGVFLIRTAFLYLREQTEMQLRKKDIELSKMKALKAQAEVASLNARINPHFLYNSLNSIAGLVRSNPEKTEQMALSLSDLFRYNINRNNTLSSTVKEEVEAVRAYLQIEQIRFGDRMKFSIEVEESIEQFEIPRNIIQPLVENAIKHGVSKIKHEGIIKVKIQKNDEVVEISVSDNGPNFPEGVITGYGLQSINDILKLSYEGEGELHWENEPVKRIWITISEKGFNNMKRFENEAV
ncbi:histidine kinase [Aestuariibaculum sp. YM273]|uniref:sensor histidine kinase n=1 Tax=Aestuariibaculum sp. YM273 TaxID=3070659 RepID=UPI0027DD40AE|nr:histidine kinase [Aestuariibaculum sp. YM273]WMI66936.1 histidine kinase [Aestuariibaculum sp. YM273]